MLFKRQPNNYKTLKSKGFTLIELLIVIFIIGLTSSVMLLNTSRPQKKQKPEIIVFLEQEYKKSLLTQQIIDIILTKSTLQSSSSDKIQLPQQDPIKQKGYLPSKTLTTFYPDGTMSANTFTIKTNEGNYVINTSPFSQNIKYSQAP